MDVPRQTVFVRFTLGGRDLRVANLELHEGLSRATHGRIEVASNVDIDVDGNLGEVGTLHLEVNDIPVRQLKLVVGKGGFLRVQQGSLRFFLDVYAPFWTVVHTHDVRKYRNLSADQIITQVLSENGIEHRWQLSRQPPVRKYCVQYRESDFDFVERLLQFEGIYYVCEDDGSLTFDDTSANAPYLEGQRDFTLLEHAGAMEGRTGLHNIAKGARVRTGAVTVNDYNWKTPAVRLLSPAEADLDADLEVYDYPSGFRKPEDGMAMAQRRLEAERADTRYVTGTTNVPFFRPGQRFIHEGTYGGDYLLLQVTHAVRDDNFDDGVSGPDEGEDGEPQTTYENQFEAIPHDVVFRPRLTTPRPSVQGVHTAMVRGPEGEEIHTDQYGRHRVQFHWDREAKMTDEDSRWLRKLQESGTGANLARIGWEISVAYVDGDPDRPIGLARDINGVMTPTYNQPLDKKLMTVRTPTYPSNGGFNEMMMDDTAGLMRIDFKAERDYMNMVKNDRTERIGVDDTRYIELNLGREVGNDQSVKVGNDRLLHVGTGRRTNVQGNRTDSIGASEDIRVTGPIAEAVEGNDTESVGSLRFTFAGEIAPPDIASNALNLVPSPPAPEEVLHSAVRGIKQAAIGGGSGGGAAARAFIGGANGALSALPDPSSLIPSLSGAASTLTGGLSDGDLTALLRGNIGRSTPGVYSRTVGGAKVVVSGNSITNEGKYLMADVVGGAKLSIAKGAFRHAIGGPYLNAVGGASMRMSDQDMGVGSKNNVVMAGLSIQMKSLEKIEMHSVSVRIEGTTELSLGVGDLGIKMTPSEIAFSGPMLLGAGDEVVFQSPDDNITS